MKKNLLTNVFAVLVVASALFFIDYVLVAVIGMVAGLFNASVFFFENIYPFVIAMVVAASIAYPLTAMLMKKGSNADSKVLPFVGSKGVSQYKQSA